MEMTKDTNYHTQLLLYLLVPGGVKFNIQLLIIINISFFLFL